MRISAIVFLCSVLLASLSIQAQNAPANSSDPATETSSADSTNSKAPKGGVEILTDTQGVNFKPWLAMWKRITAQTWDMLIPDEVDPWTLRKGQVLIRFKVQRDGRVKPGSLIVEGPSGDVALDRAAWGALLRSHYPQFPAEFHGKFLELRVLFLYNMQAQQSNGQ